MLVECGVGRKNEGMWMLVVVCKGTTDNLCECVLLLFGLYIKYDTMAYVIIWIYECIVYAFIQLRALLYILQLIFWQNELWRIARITVSGSLNRLNLAFICITILVFFSTSSEWYFHFLEDTDAVYILHLSEFVVCKGERLMWQMTLRNGLQQAIVFGYVWVITKEAEGLNKIDWRSKCCFLFHRRKKSKRTIEILRSIDSI